MSSLKKNISNGISLKACTFIVAACLFFFIANNIYSARVNSITADEYVHLPVAISIIQTGNPELDHAGSPPLRGVLALPALLYSPVMDYSSEYWQKKQFYRFSWLFMKNNFARYHDLYFMPRLMNTLFALFLFALVFIMSDSMFGKSAGAIAAVFFCFNPEITAHSSLVTVDLLTACFFLRLFSSSQGSCARLRLSTA
ncbi:MAG TPA: hypothetical protein PLN69_00730 [bacterium]|nr:hypothetical protein [bacterium]